MCIELEDWARHFMWQGVFGRKSSGNERMAYAQELGMLPNEFKPCDYDYAKAEQHMQNIRKKKKVEYINDFDPNSPIVIASFADCSTTAYPVNPIEEMLERMILKEKQEKEQAMYAEQLETQQRNHLKNRLDGVNRTKDKELREKFHMNSVQLKTEEDVEAALKEGRFKIADYYKRNGKFDPTYFGSFSTGMLQVIDPEQDEEGYEVAEKLLGKAYTEAKDRIIVLDLKAGLEALSTFESATF